MIAINYLYLIVNFQMSCELECTLVNLGSNREGVGFECAPLERTKNQDVYSCEFSLTFSCHSVEFPGLKVRSIKSLRITICF